MKPGDKVIYFQPKGFDTPVHRTATITGLTESQIDGKRAFILIDPTDPEDLPFRDWVRQSSLQPWNAGSSSRKRWKKHTSSYAKVRFHKH